MVAERLYREIGGAAVAAVLRRFCGGSNRRTSQNIDFIGLRRYLRRFCGGSLRRLRRSCVTY